MASINLKRFEDDLNRLITTATALDLSLSVELHGKKKVLEALIKSGRSKEKAEAALKDLPGFKVTYETWYSEALAVLRQLLPDRVANFVSHYEVPKNRKTVEFGTYRIQDYMQGLSVTRSHDDHVIVDGTAAQPEFRSQAAILRAARARFKSSLFEMRQLVQADLFDSEIESARELLKNKFLRAAGAVGGVVLEKHLLQVCDDHGIKISKKNPGIGDLNELLKANSVISVPQWRHISMLADIRNICDHNKAKDPTVEQVTDLLDGTEKVLKTIS
jgi:hypothetical protein